MGIIRGARTTGSSSRRRQLLNATYICGFIAGFDSTSTFILFPAIRDSLGGGDTASTTWILTIVGIVSAAVLLQAGHLTDRFGHNKIMITSAGMSVFGSVLSALSPNLIVLVTGRGLQAAALAGLGVSSIAIIVRETEEGALATALGRWAVWTAIAGVSGPIFSSVFVEYASWRFLFLTVVPVSVLIIFLGFPFWSKDHEIIERDRIDIAGTVAAMGGIALVVLALLEGNSWGWMGLRTMLSFLFGFLLIAVIVLRSKVHESPVIPLQLFSEKRFVLMTIIGFTSSLMFFGMWLALLSYAIDVWGFSLIKTGLLLTIMPGTMTLIAFPAGRFADTHGFRGVMVTGSLLFTIGFVVTASMIGSTPSLIVMIPAVVAAGIGMATVLGNTTAAGTQNLDSDLVGTGTAILQTSYRIGGSLGSAVVAAILESGTIGMSTTHEWSIWAIVITGVITNLLCLLIREDVRGV